jgi:hypothetical protein
MATAIRPRGAAGTGGSRLSLDSPLSSAALAGAVWTEAELRGV